MATTARGIVYPTVGTTLTPLANHFASLATSTNTAIDNAVGGVAAFKGLDAAKGAAGTEGRTYYATDTNRTWFDDGSNWISAENGMYLIRPTSVSGTGVTIATDGSVSLGTTGNTVTINGIFTTRFRRYKLVADWAVSGGVNGLSTQLASGGTPASGVYTEQHLLGAGTSAQSSFATSLPTWSGVGAVGVDFIYEASILNPANPAKLTTAMVDWASTNSGYGIGKIAQIHNGLAAYDGFHFKLSTTTGRTFNEGSIRIYGMA